MCANVVAPPEAHPRVCRLQGHVLPNRVCCCAAVCTSIKHVQSKLLRSQLDDAADKVQEHLQKDGRSMCWAASKGCLSCFLLDSMEPFFEVHCA